MGTIPNVKKAKVDRSEFILATTKMFLEANIPLEKVDLPSFRVWMNKYIEGKYHQCLFLCAFYMFWTRGINTKVWEYKCLKVTLWGEWRWMDLYIMWQKFPTGDANIFKVPDFFSTQFRVLTIVWQGPYVATFSYVSSFHTFSAFVQSRWYSKIVG